MPAALRHSARAASCCPRLISRRDSGKRLTLIFCAGRINRKHGHMLTSGRYVGAEAQQDDGEPFEEKMAPLVAQLHEQQAEAAKLDAAIAANLRELGYG